jgi:hypothetical protein
MKNHGQENKLQQRISIAGKRATGKEKVTGKEICLTGIIYTRPTKDACFSILICIMNYFNLIDEFEYLRLLESDDISLHIVKMRMIGIFVLGILEHYILNGKKMFELFDDEKTRKNFRVDKP